MKVRNRVPSSQAPDAPASTASLAPDAVVYAQILPFGAGRTRVPPSIGGRGVQSPE